MVGLGLRGYHKEGQVGTEHHGRALSHRAEAGAGGPNSGAGVSYRERLWQTPTARVPSVLPCADVNPVFPFVWRDRKCTSVCEIPTSVLASKSGKKYVYINRTHKIH